MLRSTQHDKGLSGGVEIRRHQGCAAVPEARRAYAPPCVYSTAAAARDQERERGGVYVVLYLVRKRAVLSRLHDAQGVGKA